MSIFLASETKNPQIHVPGTKLMFPLIISYLSGLNWINWIFENSAGLN